MSSLSVVIPVYNEQENIAALLFEVKIILDTLKKPWEVIVVDDHSSDRTFTILEETKKKVPELKVFRLKKRSGQTAALSCGLQQSKGPILVTLDGDGQNDPRDIPRLLQALQNYDCVSGKRLYRQDSQWKLFVSRCANATRQFVLHDSITDAGCSLKVFSKDAFLKIKLFRGMHRFLASLFIIEGFKVLELPVSHRPRLLGKSKYTIFNRGLSVVMDLLFVWWMKRRHIHPEVEKTLL